MVVSRNELQKTLWLYHSIEITTNTMKFHPTFLHYDDCLENIRNYDFIATDLDDVENLQRYHLPIIKVSYINFFTKPKLRIDNVPLEEYLLKKIFEPSYFFKSDDISSKDEVLTFFKDFRKHHIKTDHSFENVCLRDQILSSERNNGIVILKPIDQYASHCFLSILYCHHKFIWGDLLTNFIVLYSPGKYFPNYILSDLQYINDLLANIIRNNKLF